MEVFIKKCPKCNLKMFGKTAKQTAYNLRVHIKACNKRRKEIEIKIQKLKES